MPREGATRGSSTWREAYTKLVSTQPSTFEQFTLKAWKLIWVVVKVMVPFWVLIIIRHLIFRVPQKGGQNFDNCPYSEGLNPQP